ncbi:HAD family hydrolase [Ectothiorhodospiraceae bacterium BW-2]|nr:HAD family hydrolase [Ectothiorhodospiraceae bacterium BW-2]
MLLLPLGVVFGALVGSHWVGKRRSRRQESEEVAESSHKRQRHHDHHDHDHDHHHHHLRLSQLSLLSTTVGSWLYPPLSILNLGLISYSAAPMLARSFNALYRDNKVDSHSYSAAVALLCVGGGSYFAAAVHNSVYHLAGRTVAESQSETTRLLTESFDQQDRTLWVEREGVEIELLLSEIQRGDRLHLTTGELLAVDGIVVAGEGELDQQLLTGESLPISRRVGDRVYASTLLVDGRMTIEASCSGKESQSRQLEQLLKQTRDYKNRLQLKGEAWADGAVVPLLVVTALVWPLAGLATASALLFSAPTNTIRTMLTLQTNSHLQAAAKRGVLIKDGRVLEEFPFITTVLLDKSGTLTEERPRLVRIECCAGVSEERLLTLATAAEERLYHPVAESLQQEVKRRGLTLPRVEKSRYQPGMGVEATIDGQLIHFGSLRYIDSLGLTIPASLQATLSDSSHYSHGVVAIDDQVVGVMGFAPLLRAEVEPLLARLRALGVGHIYMVSGDSEAACRSLAEQLPLNGYFAEVLPDGKAALIARLQRQGHRICFVGDGLNDAMAMKQANVSISLNHAPELTANSAQVSLTDSDLRHIPEVMELGGRLQLNLASSLLFWVSFGAFNAIAVPLFSFGPTQSSLLYGAAFGSGFYRARRVEWSSRSEANSGHEITPESEPEPKLGQVGDYATFY